MDQIKPNMAVPVAIIIAGLAIATGIYFAGSRPATTTDQNQNTTPTVSNAYGDIIIAPITAEDHILGNPNPKMVIVEYSDFECPYCKVFHTTMHKVMDTYGKDGTVAWIYRNMPLDQLHPLARGEAEAAECVASIAGNETYWKYIDQIFAVTPSNNRLDQNQLPAIASKLVVNVSQFNTCVASKTFAQKVETQYQDGYIATGGRPGTPFNVIVLREPMTPAIQSRLLAAFGQVADVIRISGDSRRIAISGALPYEAMKVVIDTLLGK